MTSRREARARPVSIALLLSAALAMLAAAGADGYATPAPEPVRSSASGLPNGRVYEQVSPANKNGNSAGVDLANGGPEGSHQPWYALAAANGNGILFGGDGPMGAAVSSGIDHVFVARRDASGWRTIAAMPRAADNEAHILSGWPSMVDPSPDLSELAFVTEVPFAPPPDAGYPNTNQIFMANNSGPSLTLSWPGAPATPAAITQGVENPVLIGGAHQDFTLYFMYQGTLLPEDASRAPNVGEGFGNGAWGLYEYTSGTLRDVGVLPDGSLDPYGAAPAAIAGNLKNNGMRDNGLRPSVFFNEVAAEGSRVFFVSPDPLASNVTNSSYCTSSGPCSTEPPQLYVRENGQRTVLVSRDELLPKVDGLPVAAPDGPASITDTAMLDQQESATYMYASPDGSRVYFASTDQLTEGAPTGSTLKEYMFDLTTETLEYVPGIHGPIVTSSNDGSRLVFEDTSATPWELALWTIGSGGRAAGGTAEPVAALPSPAYTETNFGNLVVSPARATVDGSVFVFQTDSPIAGFNNAGGYEQVYRLDVAENQLTCVSCPPVGETPSGDAHLSSGDAFNLGGSGAGVGETDTRGMSADGSRVFFDARDPLVAQDTNGRRDVYEWEDGTVYLVSSGTGPLDSFFLDTSEDANDVFFTTADGLIGSDTDQAYDIYDARIRRRGDNPPPAAVPCQGEVCQGPPSVPQLLSVPASATFSGAGNVTESRSRAKATPRRKGNAHKKKRRGRHRRRAKTSRRTHSGTAKVDGRNR